MATASAATPAPPQVLLGHHLRQPKLPTFLREHEKLAAEAARVSIMSPFSYASPNSNSSIVNGAWTL